MSFTRKLLTGLLVASPLAFGYAYEVTMFCVFSPSMRCMLLRHTHVQTQSQWLPVAEVVVAGVIKDMGIEDTVAEITGVKCLACAINQEGGHSWYHYPRWGNTSLVHSLLNFVAPQTSMDPRLRHCLGAVFLFLDSRSG